MDLGLPSSDRRPEGARRWELYRLLAEPFRLRLLALSKVEELAIGELAELLGESQPSVSRHAKALRESGLLSQRRQGTRALVRLTEGVVADPVVQDALSAGERLCTEDGSLDKIAEVISRRDAIGRAFFEQERQPEQGLRLPSELPAYLSALAPLIASRRLAVDVGTGDGALIEVLAPIFDSVVAVDRAAPRLSSAGRRTKARGYDHVEFFAGELDDPALIARVKDLGLADVVFASRVMHHVPQPAVAMASLCRLLRPGGILLVIDYESHQDTRMGEQQADLWLGFSASELRELALNAGLVEPTIGVIPSERCGDGPDGHLTWQVLSARAPHEGG